MNYTEIIRNIFLYMLYSFSSCIGLYKIKLSDMHLGFNLVIGALLYLFGFILWLYILKTNPLSYAFPIAASMLIIGTQIIGVFLLGESFNFLKVIGLILVITGIVIIFSINK